MALIKTNVPYVYLCLECEWNKRSGKNFPLLLVILDPALTRRQMSQCAQIATRSSLLFRAFIPATSNVAYN